MQINTNGKRNITLDFDAPKKFKLKKDGAEIPYIRTGANSFRLGRNIDGVLDLEEVIEQPRIVKPMQLQAQQMALVNPNDVLMINQAAQQLEVEQNILSETQKRVEQTQAYLDVQQQRINETVLSVQGLETDNSERITATENGIFNLAGELAKAEGNSADADNYIISELDEHKTAENPHGITKETIGLNKVDNTSDLDKPISKAVQSALDEKADKDEIQAIRDELGEYQEKNDRFTNALSNYTGGLAGNQLPDGGLTGQVLAKRSDMSGDAEWVDSSASITIDDELSLDSENPVQNKVITANINSLQTSKQDVISDLATIRSGAALGATAIQSSDLATVATSGNYNDLSNKPTIPAAQVNSDWNATSGVAQILNKPTIPTVPTNVSAFTNDAGYITSSALTPYVLSADLATVATSGSYNDLTDKPTIPSVGNGRVRIYQNNTEVGNFTLNQSTAEQVYINVPTQASDIGAQDTLVSGTNIKTINNQSILGSGNIDIQGGGSSYTAGTGIDITNDVISVEGVKDQRNTSTAIKTWTGTKAQYDAIVTKDNNTLYNITDDISITSSILEILYPVGSIYITTASTCPLSTLISGSTWQLVSSGRVLQGADNDHSAGTTIEAGLPNITGTMVRTRFSGTGTDCFSDSTTSSSSNGFTSGSSTWGTLDFKASNSNNIYGSSTTVQPPAYVVNIFRRTL